MISAAASWMDSFKLPMKEIKAKYTKSDLVLLAWDSKLRSYNMLKPSKADTPAAGPGPRRDTISDDDFISPKGVRETENAYYLPEGVNNGMPIPKAAFDEQGEIDLRKLSGDQAAAYIRGLGIPIAIMPRGKR